MKTPTEWIKFHEAHGERPVTVDDIAQIQHDARKDLVNALRNLLDRHVSLVASGDCGFWNPEVEKEVIEARKVLAV